MLITKLQSSKIAPNSLIKFSFSYFLLSKQEQSIFDTFWVKHSSLDSTVVIHFKTNRTKYVFTIPTNLFVEWLCDHHYLYVPTVNCLPCLTQLRRFKKSYYYNLNSGQRARLLLLWFEFESRKRQQILFYNAC